MNRVYRFQDWCEHCDGEGYSSAGEGLNCTYCLGEGCFFWDVWELIAIAHALLPATEAYVYAVDSEILNFGKG